MKCPSGSKKCHEHNKTTSGDGLLCSEAWWGGVMAPGIGGPEGASMGFPQGPGVC